MIIYEPETNEIQPYKSGKVMETFEVTFMVTETLQNGKEWRHRKSITTPVFRMYNGRKIHFGDDSRVAACEALLKEMHYYNIEYIGTKCREILMVE